MPEFNIFKAYKNLGLRFSPEMSNFCETIHLGRFRKAYA